MRSFGGSCAFAEPKQVRRAIVVFAVDAVFSGERFFVVKQKCFVACVEVGFAHKGYSLGGDAACFHEGDRFGDALRDIAVGDVLLALFDEVVRPLVDFVQVGESSLGEGSEQVQRS